MLVLCHDTKCCRPALAPPGALAPATAAAAAARPAAAALTVPGGQLAAQRLEFLQKWVLHLIALQQRGAPAGPGVARKPGCWQGKQLGLIDAPIGPGRHTAYLLNFKLLRSAAMTAEASPARKRLGGRLSMVPYAYTRIVPGAESVQNERKASESARTDVMQVCRSTPARPHVPRLRRQALGAGPALLLSALGQGEGATACVSNQIHVRDSYMGIKRRNRHRSRQECRAGRRRIICQPALTALLVSLHCPAVHVASTFHFARPSATCRRPWSLPRSRARTRGRTFLPWAC